MTERTDNAQDMRDDFAQLDRSVKIRDRPFVPANVTAGSLDTREFWIRVHRATVERSPRPTR